MKPEPIRLLANSTAAVFDDMTWPTAGEACGDLESRLRHDREALTTGDLLTAASVLAAYRELVHCSAEKRRVVVFRLREAVKMELEGREGAR